MSLFVGRADSPLLSNDVSLSQSSDDTEVKTHGKTQLKNSLLRPRIKWPVLILTGQTIILAAAWSFYAVISRRPLPLPDYLAEAVSRKPQLGVYVVNIVAISVSLISGYLYSHAFRYAITSALARPVSLFFVHAIIRIAGRSPVKSAVQLKWTLYALIGLAASSYQSSGWMSLLTPQIISLSSPMTGFGLDILSDEFISLAFLDAFSPMSQIWSTSEFRRIFPSVQDSGFAALSKRFGGDSYFDFNAIPFNVSTGGVLPANLAEIPSVLSLDSVLPVNILTGIPNHYLPSFSRNYVLTQQGLTAKVTCKQQNLSAETDPPLIERMEPSKLGNDSIIYTSVETSCDGITVNSSQ